jgi:hypothetical protein
MFVVIAVAHRESNHMSIHSWCQRAYIRCHPSGSSNKKKSNVKVSMVRGERDTKKEGYHCYHR